MIVNPIIHNHTNLNIFEKVRVVELRILVWYLHMD